MTAGLWRRAAAWVLPALLWAWPASGGRDLAAQLTRDADGMKAALVETRRHFHAHPELSNREVETGKEIVRRLTALGYAPTAGVAGHGVVATLQGGRPGPLVAYRADMDALPVEEKNDLPFKSVNPGVMHACGHDLHVTVALGLAELFMRHRAELPGSVRFIFQPAEEGAPPGEEGGAPLMIKQGVLEGPAPVAIFGLHTQPELEAGDVALVPGPFMAAADRFRITVHGKQAHGAQPQQGVDAVYVGAQVVTALQSVVSRRNDARRPLVLTVGSFHAGSRFNILAEEAVLEGTLRTLDPDAHDQAPRDIQQVLDGVCAAHGARCTFANQVLAPVTVNHEPLARQLLPALERAAGPGHLKPFPRVMIAEDFGFLAERVPGFYAYLGVSNTARGLKGTLHSPGYLADEDALVVGVRVMAAVMLARLQGG
ncbi:MAG: amidohydrolase [Deltaproteobacteria bacterium]|nr:amidohydrolase [Deltaproteobacteria bacterium]